jgi:hypothetical protein
MFDGYFASDFASVVEVIPLTSPVINITAGTNCPTTIIAKKPRKIHTNIPLPSLLGADAANAVAGAVIPIIVASAFMTSSYVFSSCDLVAFVEVTA